MRLLWLLPKAAPALLRHIVAYVDLASLDLARAHRDIAAQAVASAIVLICGLFALFMGCLAVVACTWDTPHRVSAIAWMGGGFLLLAIAAAVRRANVARTRSQFLASVRQAWHEDRELLERLLSLEGGRPMTDRDEAARALILARLAASREELRRLIDPPHQKRKRRPIPVAAERQDAFPRSRTMRMFMSGRGLGVVGAIAAGLFIARPALALRLLRMLPAGAAARMILQRAMSILRDKSNSAR